jgi:hypothetical protein
MKKLLMALLASLTFAAPAMAEPGLTPFRGVGPAVTLHGDSNAVSTQPYYQLRAEDTWRTSYNAVAGTTIQQHMGEIQAATALDPHNITLALVSNDANPNRGGGPWIVSLWEQAFDYADAGVPDCVVVIKPYLGRTSLDRRWQFWHNNLLPVINAHPTTVKVLDWNSRVQANRLTYLLADDLHFTPSGNVAYAEALEDANYRCP